MSLVDYNNPLVKYERELAQKQKRGLASRRPRAIFFRTDELRFANLWSPSDRVFFMAVVIIVERE